MSLGATRYRKKKLCKKCRRRPALFVSRATNSKTTKNGKVVRKKGDRKVKANRDHELCMECARNGKNSFYADKLSGNFYKRTGVL